MTNPVSRTALAGFALALVAALLVAGAGPAYRLRLVDLGLAFSLLRWGALLGLAAAALALFGAWRTRPNVRRRGFIVALAGVGAGGIAFGIPFIMLQAARTVPAINDITTDTANPPRFVAIVPLRSGAPNPVDYAGEGVARQQQAAYPDISPLVLAVAPAMAFERALTAAREQGWAIVAAVTDEGRIEATDKTAWFGFEDDIVVRITPVAQGSRIDVRSLSRLGKSDLGKNAARIRAFLRRLQP